MGPVVSFFKGSPVQVAPIISLNPIDSISQVVANQDVPNTTITTSPSQSLPPDIPPAQPTISLENYVEKISLENYVAALENKEKHINEVYKEFSDDFKQSFLESKVLMTSEISFIKPQIVNFDLETIKSCGIEWISRTHSYLFNEKIVLMNVKFRQLNTLKVLNMNHTQFSTVH